LFFSADYIPGNEAAIRRLVDKLSLIGADVSYSDVSEDLINTWLGKEKKKEPIKIKELPVMITEDGWLLCMPKAKVLPMILIVGKRGKGKSITLNSTPWENILHIPGQDWI